MVFKIVRSLYGVFSLVFLTLILTTHAIGDGVQVGKYLALRKSLHAEPVSTTHFNQNPQQLHGKILELTGKISGMMKCGDITTFLMDCSGTNFVVKVGQDIPSCIANGNTIRALVKVGKGCQTSLSDLELKSAAYDYDVTSREAKLESNPEQQSSDPAVYYVSGRVHATSQSRSGLGLSSRAMQIYDPYKEAIAKFNPKLMPYQVEMITSSILFYSEKYGVDPRLAVALIIAESGFRPTATSHKGAMGLGQLMPGTAKKLGVGNAYDPQQNIQGCIRLLRGNLEKYQGDISLALAAYNAGSGAVKKYGGVPPYKETRNYITKVTSIYKALCGQ